MFDWWIFGLSSFEERVKEASSSEVPQKARDQCVHIVILWKSLVASLCNHTSEVWYYAELAHCVVGFKVLRNFYANCGESVQPLQS